MKGPKPKPLVERFLSKVEPIMDDRGCWEWVGGLQRNGYGKMGAYKIGRLTKMALAHRVAYECFIGPIPEGLTIDHLCRNRSCVNPKHMELVTQKENVLRGNALSAQRARRTECPKGHAYDSFSDGRRCKKCRAEQIMSRRNRSVEATS